MMTDGAGDVDGNAAEQRCRLLDASDPDAEWRPCQCARAQRATSGVKSDGDAKSDAKTGSKPEQVA